MILTSKKKSHLADMAYAHSPLNRPPEILDAADGRVRWDERRKVCIYGAGLGRQHAPLDDPSWVVLGLNVIAPLDRQRRLRADAWFEIHQRHAQSADDMRWIAACPVPLFVPTDLLASSRNAVRYPLERVEAAFGSYFACTFAYQIALFLLEGFTDIGLYGVELAYGTPRERSVEFACVSWWMGYAEARGVRFHLPPGSRLGRHPFRYGIEYDAERLDVKAYIARVRQEDASEAHRQLERESVGG